MRYGLAEHRHRFAVWAAARAAQRGFTTAKNLREALQATDIRDILSDPLSLQLSATQFDALHRRWCSTICSFLTQRAIANVTYGRAAKVVAVYLRVIVIMGDASDSSLGRNLHPPVDRILLQSLASSDKIKSPHKPAWRLINWTQLDEAGYQELICQLRSAIPNDTPFWTLEEYWEPSDTADEAL